MAMPEAPMNKYRYTIFCEYQIGATGESLFVKPISEAHPMQEATHCQFRFGILRPDSSHHPRASGAIDYVHASWYPGRA